MKKKTLEIKLERVERYRNPKNLLEQYFTPPSIAADILFFAYLQGDIENKIVADLGAGTGIFSIGASLLGARKIYAVEIDPDAIAVMRENLEKFGCSNIEIIQGDISSLQEKMDTVIQNPPFGSQRKHADLPFLIHAMHLARVVYSLHNSETREFLLRKIGEEGAHITHERRYSFPIPRTFFFHRKELVLQDVVLFRIETKKV